MPILAELHLYPIKSCAGISLRQAGVSAAGLMHAPIRDREWMLVDERGDFLTQREHPRMALIAPQLRDGMLQVRAPGMPELALPLHQPQPEPRRAALREVQLWRQRMPAQDCGDDCAAWFSAFLGASCRLVRFEPQVRRLVNPERTGGKEIGTLFSDGYPMLVISQAALDELNLKLAAIGRAALPMNRFRPNIVIAGVEAHDEDHAALLDFGAVRIKPVKPCPRCPIPSIDQASAIQGPDPLDVLRSYRAGIGGIDGIAFGMNAILEQGDGEMLCVGQELRLDFGF
jgi:uncharacterized protein YcbX